MLEHSYYSGMLMQGRILHFLVWIRTVPDLVVNNALQYTEPCTPSQPHVLPTVGWHMVIHYNEPCLCHGPESELGMQQFFSFATTSTRQHSIAAGTSQGPEKIEK